MILCYCCYLVFFIFYFDVFIVVVGYCLDVWKTQLQERESSARNHVSESSPNFTVSRYHLLDNATQAVSCFFYTLPSELTF